MEFEDLIAKRYSVRAYSNRPIEDYKLNRILNAARLAPSAANKQPYKIIVIHTEGRKDDLKRIYSAEWFVQAPIVLAICGIMSEAWVRKDGKNHVDVDCAIAMDHIILAATNLGFGTCWICAFDPQEAKRILGIPMGVEPVAFTPLGYPSDTPVEKKRKSIDMIVCYEKWQ
ncbi:MAG TPA: nitroreductase family protein [Candidatus Ratteibacteria bacterium]|mgnify:CR=1 FL=1|jgi:nitroreductase|uniref:FMN reductase (NAD(P)H) n=1 Tax=candidate division TA06 bacterium ADurb.Bin131 TaxID=1852827 RepID=A0A1V6CDI5_UNCT6|nr:MAG: FMN reductase (NAD(P)H) [candidate division TA06 bacterium ADurb.Bin131]HOC03714.1 nitroreductase family protein [bacterium]HRS06125.1 nitroreductase family protein [Candidatus Ratteibacteria bacterium]HON05567.1 nitroreductase family protein [bacterium]HPC30206.1 nitroreductase family protein [bacterium]